MHRHLQARMPRDEDKNRDQLLEDLCLLRSQQGHRAVLGMEEYPVPTAPPGLAENIVESLEDSVFVLDAHWRLRYLNSCLEKLLERPRTELLDKNFWEEFPQLAHTLLWEQLHRAMSEGIPVQCEIYSPIFGSWVLARAFPGPAGVLTVQLQDISERRESERLLGEQMKELERLNYLKDDFLSTVSHELRTPMANMIMAIRLLKNAPEDKRLAYLGILERECVRETNLINDLLDLQELTVKPRTRLSEVINLAEWLPMLVEPFRSRAEQFRQQLSLDVREDTPNLIADTRSLERVVAELLNNACKYTVANGKILIQAEPAASEAGKSFVLLKVTNTGEIPDAEQKRIFDKFYRIPRSDSWAQGGTGLGLALVKRVVVENLFGEIGVQSQAGLVTFAVRLPIGSSESAVPPAPRRSAT